MMDNRLSQLRQHLSSRGVSDDTIEDIIDSINASVRQQIESILENNIYSASQRAEELRAKGFLKEIAVRPTHAGFEITTDSGNHDFGRQPFPMLDRLLARGKVAKDGSTYKVIPLGSNKNTTTEVVKDIAAGVSSIKGSKDKPRSLTEMVSNIAQSFGVGARQIAKIPEPKAQDQVQFRTASSKQDRSRQWVLPGIEADMAPVLNEINASMAADIQNAIDSAIREHQMEIEHAIRNA